MKRFLAHMSYVLLLIPLLLVLLFAYCDLKAGMEEQYGALYAMTVHDQITGDVRKEQYRYGKDYTEVTCTRFENGTETGSETWTITWDDPLLTDTFEILPHPTAENAAVERIEEAGYVVVRYLDAQGNLLGYSELTYGDCDRLQTQHDFAADGTVLRITTRSYIIHSYGENKLDPAGAGA